MLYRAVIAGALVFTSVNASAYCVSGAGAKYGSVKSYFGAKLNDLRDHREFRDNSEPKKFSFFTPAPRESKLHDLFSQLRDKKPSWESIFGHGRSDEHDWDEGKWPDIKNRLFDKLSDRWQEGKLVWWNDLPAYKQDKFRDFWDLPQEWPDAGVSQVPLPAGAWLFLSAFAALIGWKKRGMLKRA